MNFFLIVFSSVLLGIFLIVVGSARMFKAKTFWNKFGPKDICIIDPFKKGNMGWTIILALSSLFVLSMFIPSFSIKLDALIMSNEILRSSPVLLGVGIIWIIYASIVDTMKG